MAINRELFKKIHEQITAHPENHNQRTYEEDVERIVALIQANAYDDSPERVAEDLFYVTHRVDEKEICGTTRCVAGWSLFLHKPDQLMYQTADQIVTAAGEESYSTYFDGARILLGLTHEQAEELFSSDLSESDAVRLVAGYAGIDED